MAQSKKKWVAFKTNATVPADVLGEKDDQKMQVGQPVQLPEAYADHVVHEGFAEFCEAPDQKSSPKKSPAKKPASKKPVEPTEAEKAAAEKAGQIADAEKAVTDAQAALDAVGLGMPAGGEMAALKAAQDALAALQD